jgi:hypothetical protein
LDHTAKRLFRIRSIPAHGSRDLCSKMIGTGSFKKPLSSLIRVVSCWCLLAYCDPEVTSGFAARMMYLLFLSNY